MVKLSHDGGLGQEVPPLFVSVARLQTLDGHVDLPLSLHTQAAAAHLPKLSYTHRANSKVSAKSACVCVCVWVCTSVCKR